MEESRKVSSWELYLDGLDEGTSECPVEENESVQGEGKWKKGAEQERLGDLRRLLWKKKSAEIQEVARIRRMKSDFEETGLDESDSLVQMAIEYRESWKSEWHGLYGRFEDVTINSAAATGLKSNSVGPFAAMILPMRYTYQHAPPLARTCKSLQIYSAKVENVTGLSWPLHVFGMVAARDMVDHNRNFVFYRTRNNCQTLTEADPYLVLTGPTRAVVMEDVTMLEVCLKVKGDTENEDKLLCYDCWGVLPDSPHISQWTIPLEPIRLGISSVHVSLSAEEVLSSVEATIFVRVVEGSWPEGFHGHFGASSRSMFSSSHTNGFPEVILLDFGADKVPVGRDGYMNLSRHVVSVSVDESLKVHFMASRDDKAVKVGGDDSEVVKAEVLLMPEEAGRSYANFCFGSCVMEVLVAWSLVLPEPQPDVPDSFEGYLD
ncbi:hypothetical protein EJB05_11138 [Eragrostis curvula]|uniref:DUF6598 domain-containing protein n=1 Tax=Eragrostis curvula TaxID=38414 RepID=A0A5J9VN58_9POAL|nr:hypothetical protein EJB05_11138 [Eragrostis curvula]